ncbi:MAG: hypothetical protein JKY45_12150 [Emcibacter sp.]|nr:hypothetical protein [Emcibacter sp.]
MSAVYAHNPDAVNVDYSIDFSVWLTSGDSVAGCVWEIFPNDDNSPIKSDPTKSGAVVTTKISGGLLGATYRLTAHITTENGLQDKRSIILKVGHL